ncbi:MAG TPA: glutamine--fructose-6-phosphate transaminase (isomerizing) [Candidatus Babeliales bacterium]|nr:glutamine--fructose-6-phosphate transaminase (isomerizing) [Candidatus Babeliales bacterium]
MCSVVGYVGADYSRKFVLEGLSRLEYRGYDSAGFACIDPDDNRLMYAKSEGKLRSLVALLEKEPIDGFVGIGHTRWATHGVSSQQNAHPHFDCEKLISVVHNGIIENHHVLKHELEAAGHTFHSETDTEIIAHLFEDSLSTYNELHGALVDLVGRLQGAYAFISLVQNYPDTIILVRKRSPLCIGIGQGEMFVASDMLAFAGKCRNVVFMPDESFALVRKSGVELYRFDGTPLPLLVQEVDVTWDMYEKQGHDHYMLKEIYEQKTAIHNTVNFLHSVKDRIWADMGVTGEQIFQLDTINLIGCGTSWHAGYIAKFFFETICMIPVQLHLGSEFRYLPFFPAKNSIFIAISQSGETADTLEAVRMVNEFNIPTVALTNVSSSTMLREAGGFVLTQAGREIAVASTKAFSTQITALYWLAHRIAYEKKIITAAQLEGAQEDLLIAAEVLENTIENYKLSIIKELAPRYARYGKMIFLGRHSSYPFALEAALKLKEIAYIFAATYPAGELKHGPLALIDADTPVIIFSHQDPIIYQKLLANVQEVKARGGHIIAFAFEGQYELIGLADVVFEIPRVKPLLGPLAMTGLMQFFFYAIAKELDRPIDKPRNLAKSVTVE